MRGPIAVCRVHTNVRQAFAFENDYQNSTISGIMKIRWEGPLRVQLFQDLQTRLHPELPDEAPFERARKRPCKAERGVARFGKRLPEHTAVRKGTFESNR